MAKESPDARQPYILIVEDDPVNIDLMKAQLSTEGYSIGCAHDGEEALNQLAYNKPDLVLLDIMIPKKSGYEVCKHIKSMAETRHIPVIMVTALNDMESRVKGIAAGADDFLSRPVDRSELLARVRSMLRVKHLHDELTKESRSARESNQKIELQKRVLKSMSAQLMHASHLKYEFIVDMSHALRTPLNVIIGFSEMLQDELVGTLNDKQARYVANVLESGRELQGLIADIVDLFKIDTGKLALEMTEFSLKDAIDSAIAAFDETARAKQIEISVHVAPNVTRVFADPQRFTAIMNNLLSNAFKFTPGKAGVEVTAERVENTVRVCVADSGPGLLPEDCEKVFSEFYRVSDPAIASCAGSGLGLAIARKLVYMHGGQIWAESTKGSGARFFFTLPYRQKTEG
ncbi:MAG: hybrid sensor histidine kinase/response regulator [Candidatus Abyssobacteria bacterium SURF_17]|uniref:histidine kinase n=1 Tax=Candidatus Abyssobacteria bacterium SURF_17 TaxID=2093361 RepID=A0A419ENR0_9BACT|nr:MAG: hybrid sensor histidine kinase/response regulator [Candidatus Abyssubacteria bacterium SURF_17]